jgi:uncharacterized protein (TIGR02145 family)
LAPITITIPGATQVTGTLVDCNNATVSSGYVLAGGQVHFANSSGQFSFSSCGSSITVYPYSSSPLVAGQSQTINLTGGTQNIGNVQVCSGGGGTGTVTDIDGNSYSTIQIGTQEWMRDNLKTSKYKNGDNIASGLTDNQWASTTSGAWCTYNDSIANNNIYGKMYNYYAVIDPRGLCPAGWHVPTQSEWLILAKTLDPNVDTTSAYPATWYSLSAGALLKSTGTYQAGNGLWFSPNTGASNLSGFSGHPGGWRFGGGAFMYKGQYGMWWTSYPPYFGTGGSYFGLQYNDTTLLLQSAYSEQGLSVRCIKD